MNYLLGQHSTDTQYTCTAGTLSNKVTVSKIRSHMDFCADVTVHCATVNERISAATKQHHCGMARGQRTYWQGKETAGASNALNRQYKHVDDTNIHTVDGSSPLATWRKNKAVLIRVFKQQNTEQQ